MSILTQVILIAALGAAAWWLSGYDTGVTGEDKAADFTRRALRCGVTVALLILTTLNPYFALYIFVLLGVTWASCLAEFFSRKFHKLIDPEDDREFDPKATERNLDLLAQLTRQGRIKEALEFCEKLQKSGEVSPLTLEATLHHLYQEILASVETSPFLQDVRSSIDKGEFAPAEARLKQILAAQPGNWAAMLLLMRMYVKGMSRADKALAVLEPANKQAQPAFVKYARGSIEEWIEEAHRLAAERNSTDSQKEPLARYPELSVDELLQTNQLATAVERLEKDIREQPGNFEFWLKLAEIYAVHCADLNRAGKIIQKMESTGAFNPQEIQSARAKLREWQTVRRV